MKQQRHTRQSATRSNPSPVRRNVKSLRLTLSFLLVALALAGYHFLSTPPPVEAVSTTVVISQIYGAGGNGGATYRNDYIELYNRGTTPVSLNGWSVQYSGATSTTGNFSVTPLTNFTLQPGQYYLIQEDSGGANGTLLPTADATGTIVMAAGAGKVALVNNTTPLAVTATGCPSFTNVVDFVGYGTTANCREGATSANNAPAPSATTADVRVNGGRQDTDVNSADFTATTPNPRNSSNFSNGINVDSSAQGCNFFSVTGNTSFTWNHTIGGGTNRILIVGVSTSYETLPLGLPSDRVLSVTYNGQAMTRIGTIVGADTRIAVEMFRLTEGVSPGVPTLPAAGSYPVIVNLITPTPDYAVGGSASFSSVNQSTPNGTFQTATGTSTNPTVNVPSAGNQIVIDTVATTFNGGTLLVGPGQTERWNGLSCFGGVSSIGAGSTEPGATTTTMSWTETTSQPWAIGAVALQPVSPTAVKLASFDAVQTGKGVALGWKTGYEVDNLGFNVYREQGGKRTRLNPSLIAGSALMAGQGTRLTAGESYAWLDRSAKGKDSAQYWLEDIDLSGTRTLHGPIAAVAGDSSQASIAEQSVLLSRLNDLQPAQTAGMTSYPAALMQKAQQQTQELPAPAATKGGLFGKLELPNNQMQAESRTKPDSGDGLPVVSPVDPARQRALAAVRAIKIDVQQTGWYRVTQPELVAAGLSPVTDPGLIQLYADGVEQPILLNGSNKQFGADSSIEFYGTGMDTPTSLTRTYWLIVGAKSGKRINPTGQNNNISHATDANAKPAASNRQPAIATGAPDKPMVTILRVPGVRLILPDAAPSPKVAPAASGAIPLSASKTEYPFDAAPASSPAPPKAVKKKKVSRKKKSRKPKVERSHASISKRASQDIEQEPSTQGFPYVWERKDRTFYFAGLLNGDADNFFGPLVMSTPVNQDLNINNLDKSVSGPATLEVALQGVTAQPHQVKVSLNGTEVGVVNFNNTEHTVARFYVRRTALVDGTNSVSLTSLGGSSDVNLVDYTRLTYWHTYRAENDALAFNPQQTTPTKIDGFTNANIRVFDITDQSAVEQVNVNVSQQGAGFAVSVPGSGNKARTLLAVADSKVLHPLGVTTNEPSSLSSNANRADLVILAHKDFLGAVKPLADLRRSQGLETLVVDVQDVYDEFSYGAHSRQAVKDFFARAMSNWELAPRYALLVGDSSIDPLNRLGFGNQDFVPTKLVDATVLETASDDALCDFDNDGLADMAVGRLPVKTNEQAQKLIGKITNYSPGQTAYGALLVADRQDGYDFEATSNQVRGLLPQALSVTTVNRRDNPTDQVKSEILGGINSGPLLVNFAGHGSSDVWTGAGILSVADAGTLTNGNRLPVFLMMTCLNGRFQDPNRESLAEALMKAEGGGAIAVWASSGLTAPDPQSAMDQQLIRLLFGDGQSPTLGDAVRGAKAATSNQDVRRTWILFGDPTMRIR